MRDQRTGILNWEYDGPECQDTSLKFMAFAIHRDTYSKPNANPYPLTLAQVMRSNSPDGANEINSFLPIPASNRLLLMPQPGKLSPLISGAQSRTQTQEHHCFGRGVMVQRV